MSTLSPKGRDLVRAGRRAFSRPMRIAIDSSVHCDLS
jgi:hypothetical protein